MTHEPLHPTRGSQEDSDSPPARVVMALLLSNAIAIAMLLGLVAPWVNAPLANAAVSWLSSVGVSALDVVWVELSLLFVEFLAAMWLIYGVIAPRVWPEARRRRAQGEEKWTKEEVIILLLVILIALEIFD